MYFHAEGRVPDVEVPELPELLSSEWTGWQTRQLSIRAPLADINEKAADLGRYYGVYEFAHIDIRDVSAEGDPFHIAIRAEVPLLRRAWFSRLRRSLSFESEFEFHGAGFHSDRLKVGRDELRGLRLADADRPMLHSAVDNARYQEGRDLLLGPPPEPNNGLLRPEWHAQDGYDLGKQALSDEAAAPRG